MVVIERALVTISPAIFSVSNAAFFIVLSQYSAGSVLHSDLVLFVYVNSGLHF